MGKIFNRHAKQDLFDAAEPGDIFFSRSRTCISWLIRKATKFHSSHTFVKVNERTVIESDVGGIKIHPAKKYLDDCVCGIECVQLPKGIDRRLFIDKLSEKTGSYYDYGILLGSLISKVFKITRWRDNILNGVSRYTCSEYVAECLKLSGMEFSMPTSQITPKDLYYLLKKAEAKNSPKRS